MQNLDRVELVARDDPLKHGHGILTTWGVVKHMGLVTSLWEGREEGEYIIPLPGIEVNQLQEVIGFCYNQSFGAPMVEIPKLTLRRQLKNILTIRLGFHVRLVKKIDSMGLVGWVKLGHAARYLDVQPLVQLVHARVREATMNKDWRTICRLMGVTGEIPLNMQEQVASLCAWDIEDFWVTVERNEERSLEKRLFSAAAKNPSEPSVLTLLLDCFKGQNPAGDYQETFNNESLWTACCAGQEARVCELLAQGADPNTKGRSESMLGFEERTALHCAVQSEFRGITRHLLVAGALPNLDGVGVTTPLTRACRNKDLGTMRLLLEYGAHIQPCDMNVAITNGDTGVVRVLLEEGAVDVTLDNVKLALRHAQDGILSMCFARGIPDPTFTLGMCVYFKNTHMARLALGCGGDPNGRGVLFPTRQSFLSGALDRDDMDMVLLLLDANADPTLPEDDGPDNSPTHLHHALRTLIRFRSLPKTVDKVRSVIKAFLQKGANANVPTASGILPLQHVLDAANNDFETCRIFLCHGADPNIRFMDNTTPLFNVRDPEILRLLLRHGADPSITNGEGQTAAMVFALEGNDSLSQLLLEAEAVSY